MDLLLLCAVGIVVAILFFVFTFDFFDGAMPMFVSLFETSTLKICTHARTDTRIARE